LVFFLILCSCGEFDSVLPINQTYQVSATAGDHSLDEYAGIRLDDEIQPFFVQSIKGDQDIRGLVVSLQTPGGKPAGQKIRYLFGGPEEEDDGEVLPLAAGRDGKLPRFRMGEELPIGPYLMVFQILGEKGKIFSKTEKAIFYLAGADYHISEISAYLPGYSPDSYLIAPGTIVMLEARVTAAEDLDPYIVWYDGKRRIGEGRISAGGGSLFFTVPGENGFRLLRAEAYPFPRDKKNGPENAGPEETARGKIRELSLPVSLKGTGPDYVLFSEKEGENFAAHYLFAGDLRDSLDPGPERALIKENEDSGVRWLGYGGIFGLPVGPGDCYLIPQEIFGFSGQDEGKKIFNFRAKLLRDGPFFSVLLANDSGEIQLSGEKEHLVLTLTTEGNSKKVEAALPPAEDFISFSLSLDFRGNSPAAVLSPDGALEASLDLTGVSAEGAAYRLGTPVPVETGEEKDPGEEAQDPPGLPALILDELAVTAEE
jgi:hypothetical protein